MDNMPIPLVHLKSLGWFPFGFHPPQKKGAQKSPPGPSNYPRKRGHSPHHFWAITIFQGDVEGKLAPKYCGWTKSNPAQPKTPRNGDSSCRGQQTLWIRISFPWFHFVVRPADFSSPTRTKRRAEVVPSRDGLALAWAPGSYGSGFAAPCGQAQTKGS